LRDHHSHVILNIVSNAVSCLVGSTMFLILMLFKIQTLTFTFVTPLSVFIYVLIKIKKNQKDPFYLGWTICDRNMRRLCQRKDDRGKQDNFRSRCPLGHFTINGQLLQGESSLPFLFSLSFIMAAILLMAAILK